MQQENQSDMIAILEGKVASHPNSIEAIRELADAYADQERWSDAIEKYRIAISLDSRNADLYNELGIAYEELGELQKAEDAYQQAIALNPNDSMPYYNLGDWYEKQQRMPEAVRMYKKCLQLPTDSCDRAELEGKIIHLTSETVTGQSRLAYRLAAVILFLSILINLISFAIAGDGTTIISNLIDFVLAIGLLQFRPGARNFALFRAALGVVLGPILAFVSNDVITATVMSVMQWGYCGAIILLLTGQSTTRRLILAVAIFALFSLGVFVVLLLLVVIAQTFAGI